ncbi:hypothetical protein BCR39DRAFT_544616 [Naematelia encephala]|uniref:S-adenosyl-L-methionine-dependent methyltransferase n=1 Tax=Naematelia encephala TaxID=71784 RepID=A0A1Y2ARP8_9TREE|nr:hypothetical protein BCR39DRAFT_544616 [Naematelia encephala]
MPSPFVILLASLPLIFRLIPMLVPSHVLEPYNLWSPDSLNTKPGVKWRNMGYWEDTEDYSQAAEALASKLLDFAGEVESSGNILDIAHGTGESLCLHLSRIPPPEHLHALTSLPHETELARQLVSIRYPNTTTSIQFFTASASYRPGKDLDHPLNPLRGFMGESSSSSSQITFDSDDNDEDEDEDLNPSFSSPSASSSSGPDGSSSSSPPPYDLIYILDAIYHFPPSVPYFLSSALRVLKPSTGTIVYTDILPPSTLNAGLAHLILPWSWGVPAKNFVSRPKSLKDYQALLERVGYEDIVIEDWSSHVWSGFAKNLRKRGWAWKVVARGVEWAQKSGWRFVAVRARRPGFKVGSEEE